MASRTAAHTLLSVLLAAALPAFAASGKVSGKSTRKTSKKKPAAAAAQRALIDPATGQLVNGPLPESSLRPAHLAGHRYVEEPVEGGGVKVALAGTVMAATVARIDANGKLSYHCVTTTGKDLKAPHAHAH